jgi:hypothetical protein
VSVKCTPKSSEESAAAIDAASANHGHGTITEPLVIEPNFDNSLNAVFAP